MGLKDAIPNIKGALSFESFDSDVNHLRDNVGDAGIYDYSLEVFRQGGSELGPVPTIMRIVAVRFVRPIILPSPLLGSYA